MRERLDVSLVRRGLVASRSVAQRLITDGSVRVGGDVVVRPSASVDDSTVVDVAPGAARFVSRAGDKLDFALDEFGVEVVGRRAVDAGASTGGFTDCLLQHGARSVLAIDAGTDQLAAGLHNDDRVSSMEQTDVRGLDPAAVDAPFDVVTADLSFISLCKVLPTLAPFGGPESDFVLLVKPQFEVGRDHLDKSGVVRDPMVRWGALVAVVDTAKSTGLGLHGVASSPRPGGSGNIEFLVHLRHGQGVACLLPDWVAS